MKISRLKRNATQCSSSRGVDPILAVGVVVQRSSDLTRRTASAFTREPAVSGSTCNHAIWSRSHAVLASADGAECFEDAGWVSIIRRGNSVPSSHFQCLILARTTRARHTRALGKGQRVPGPLLKRLMRFRTCQMACQTMAVVSFLYLSGWLSLGSSFESFASRSIIL